MAKTKTTGEATNSGSKCPVTNAEFMAKAPPVTIRIGETGVLVAGPKEMKTGSVGYHVSEKVTLVVDGKPVKFQANILLTAVGSKPQE